jgi:hypothetical protein
MKKEHIQMKSVKIWNSFDSEKSFSEVDSKIEVWLFLIIFDWVSRLFWSLNLFSGKLLLEEK